MNEKTQIKTISLEEFSDKEIKNRIYYIRQKHVMLDEEISVIYNVQLKRMNEQVKRNLLRFPDNYRFQLTENEYKVLRSQFATLKNDGKGRGQHRKYLPYVFTEQGVAMLSSILNSETAIKVSISIMNAFVEMRHHISKYSLTSTRLDVLELRQLKNEEKFNRIFKIMGDKHIPQQGIFFDGQVFDAHVFASDLIKTAKRSIILIDNYISEETLSLLSNKQKEVKLDIYTKDLNAKNELAIKRFQKQYPECDVHVFTRSHDRFVIIDEKEVYHIGASLKDLGKKWFAFTKLELETKMILEELTRIQI